MRTTTHSRRTLIWCLGVLALAGLTAPGPASAQQNQTPVEVEVQFLFGRDMGIDGAQAPVRVNLRNRTREAMSGRVKVVAAGSVHWVALDLPAEAERTTLVTVAGGQQVRAEYWLDTRVMGSAELWPSYANAQWGILLISDPPRLLPRIGDLTVDQMRHGSLVSSEVPAAAVSIHPQTSDPLLPTTPAGYSSLGMVVACGGDLPKLSAEHRSAMDDWVHAGGRLLVFPQGQSSFRDPMVADWIGTTAPIAREPNPLTPASLSEGIGCPPDSTTEAFGCSARRGFGRVYVAAYDGCQRFADDPATRQLVLEIASVYQHPGGSSPSVQPFRGNIVMNDSRWDDGANLFELRRALDPNESYRPAMGFAAILLLLYVLVIGPLNFSFVLKRKKPVLALLTTPVLAFVFLGLLLLVGFAGKGAMTRYRTAELVEAHAGSDRAVLRRYTGLFFTRPRTIDLAGTPDVALSVVPLASAGTAPEINHTGDSLELTGINARLWETVFFREDGFVDLGGSVTFGARGGEIVSVRNGTSLILKGAVLVWPSRSVYTLGDIAPGQERAVPPQGTMVFRGDNMYGRGATPEVVSLSREMNIDESDLDLFNGLLRAAPNAVTTQPVLLAWVEDEATGQLFEDFSRESQLRLVRIVVSSTQQQGGAE